MNIAYIRGKSEDSIEEDKKLLKDYNIHKWYIEKGMNNGMTLFDELVFDLEEEDIVFVISISRISRNVMEVYEKLTDIKESGAKIEILNCEYEMDRLIALAGVCSMSENDM